MALYGDLLCRLTFRQGEDTRKFTGSASDKLITESASHQFILVGTSSTKLNIYGIDTNAGAKLFWLETNKSVQVHFNNTLGKGLPVAANGFAAAWVTNTTSIWVKNAGTSTATVTCMVGLISA